MSKRDLVGKTVSTPHGNGVIAEYDPYRGYRVEGRSANGHPWTEWRGANSVTVIDPSRTAR